MREALEKEVSQKKGVTEERRSDYKMGRDGLPVVFKRTGRRDGHEQGKKETRAREKTEVTEAGQPEIQRVFWRRPSLIIFGQELKLRYFQSFTTVCEPLKKSQ